jgi:transcriptional regulator with XRE-family HTH domain
MEADDWRPKPTTQVRTTAGQEVIVDGPTLRSARQSQNVPMRKVARVAGMSHGHLSKVERGEHGRPVTPAILLAYERVLGIKIADAVASGELARYEERRTKQSGKVWRPGQLSAYQRQTWRAQIAAVGAGGSIGISARRMLDSAGRVTTAIDSDDVATMQSLERIVTVIESGGGLTGTAAHALLGWAIRLPPERTAGNPAALNAVVARLARAAATAAYAANRHESARVLWLLGLNAAAAADHADLRALVLSDIAEQHAAIGYVADAVAILRLADGDERIDGVTRARLKAVRARADAADTAEDQS